MNLSELVLMCRRKLAWPVPCVHEGSLESASTACVDIWSVTSIKSTCSHWDCTFRVTLFLVPGAMHQLSGRVHEEP